MSPPMPGIPCHVWEIAGNGHVDAAMVAFVLVGLLVYLRGRTLAAGVLITLGALIKPFALLALPVLWRPWNWRLPMCVAATVALVYLPYLSVGSGVFSFVPGYLEEEGLVSGSGFKLLWLVQLATGPLRFGTVAYVAAAALALGVLALAVGFRSDRSAPCIDACHQLDADHLPGPRFAELPLVFPGACAVSCAFSVSHRLGPGEWRRPVLRYRSQRRLAGVRGSRRRIHAGRLVRARARSVEGVAQAHSGCSRRDNMSAQARTPSPVDPRRYHESVDSALRPIVTNDPVCLYLETTNRCNLLCTTCPRTYADLEPEADMSWELFTRIVDQVPNIARVVLHGVGEPMLVKELPRMVRYLKARGAYVLFNTNGTVLTAEKGQR
ncbi:MAG: DUF2029 domain-containing protein, partial [Sphingomonadales bacterium]|nr:DUF2029 domain-containing protein [Sphingomonadales bacterium]